MKKRELILVFVVGLLVLAYLIYRPAKQKTQSQKTVTFAKQPASSASAGTTFAAPIATPHPFASPGEIALKAVAPAPLADPAERSPLADKLNATSQSIGADLAIVFDLFEHYRGMYGGLPTGENNAQVVNALSGNNPRRMAFLERSNPALNQNGELIDRWGTPFFFHFISRDAMEIRSAGIDREFYTADDALKSSPSLTRPAPEAAQP